MLERSNNERWPRQHHAVRATITEEPGFVCAPRLPLPRAQGELIVSWKRTARVWLWGLVMFSVALTIGAMAFWLGAIGPMIFGSLLTMGLIVAYPFDDDPSSWLVLAWLMAIAACGIMATNATDFGALSQEIPPRVSVEQIKDHREAPALELLDAEAKLKLRGSHTQITRNKSNTTRTIHYVAPLVPTGWQSSQPVPAWLYSRSSLKERQPRFVIREDYNGNINAATQAALTRHKLRELPGASAWRAVDSPQEVREDIVFSLGFTLVLLLLWSLMTFGSALYHQIDARLRS
jgi:hypothetical protein